MDKTVKVEEIITLLSFMVSTVSLFISYSNFRSLLDKEDYSTHLVLSLLILSFILAVSYGIYLTIRLIKSWRSS